MNRRQRSSVRNLFSREMDREKRHRRQQQRPIRPVAGGICLPCLPPTSPAFRWAIPVTFAPADCGPVAVRH